MLPIWFLFLLTILIRPKVMIILPESHFSQIHSMRELIIIKMFFLYFLSFILFGIPVRGDVNDSKVSKHKDELKITFWVEECNETIFTLLTAHNF